MAAPSGTTAEDSSSEDDLEKFKEASWSFPKSALNATNNTSTADGGNKLSRRVSVSKHEHDGNELQTTPEFRVHVAKKLGAILDSCISEKSADTSKRPHFTESTKCEDANGEGFRLFTTSIPGEFSNEQPPPVRHRTIPSSRDSDSEIETRLREAAVSVKDLISSALPLAVIPSQPEPPSSGKIKKKNRANEGEVDSQDRNCSLAPKKRREGKLLRGTVEV
ncbi:hypothetical protein DPEC_G00262530 [Dallia pectoralis]|uniref:Uncharacterized protein n=1 Tax=Dallia pectoralis TaxID=75939 RepID=A0ACC2FS05_DALPE|nr:hypothetical protein DPEC_G00262530 [Dallia pectoralis]